MFRYTRSLATDKRGETIREGREEELEKLVGEARAFQELLCRDAPGLSTSPAPTGHSPGR